MGFFDSLFGGNNAPTPALPTAPPANYAEFIKNLADAAAANVHLKPWTERGLLTAARGDDLNAARANVIAGAPQAYDAYQTGHTGAQSGQLGLGQSLAYINNFRAARGLPPVDANNIPGTFNGAAPTAKPSLAPDTGVAPAATPQDATPFTPQPRPQVSAAPLAPPQGTPPGADMSALFTRVANSMPQGMPMAAPPAAPVTPQPGTPNPLDAQRANFGSMATAMSGLPAFASLLPELNKLINQGVEPGRTVNYGTGAVSDVNNGLPITTGANEDAANKAGGISAVQEVPHVVGANLINDHSTVNQRGTDAAKIAGEFNAHIGETNNEKAQDFVEGYSKVDGSPVRVSKHDLATGAVQNVAPGVNPYVEKHSKELEAANKDAQEAAQGLIQAKQLAAAAQGLSTGAWGDDIQDIRRGLASLGIGSAAMNKAATKGDVVNEIGLELAALRARASSSGRTALGTLNAFRSVKPGLLSTNPAAQVQALLPAFQRQVDYAEFANKYYNDPGNWNKLDAPTAFRAASPDDKYVNAAAPPEPMPVVKNALKPGKSYFLPNNQIGTWNGQGFEVQQ